MTSEIKSGQHDRIGLWMILLVVAITAAVFLWSRSNYQHDTTSLDTHINTQGHLHVLGVTLGETTLKQAELILQSKSDVALYIYPENHPKAGLKMEAFFPAIADHTKIILLLNIDKQLLHDIEERATIPHLYPDEVARMNLAAKDRGLLDVAIVDELTLIPSVTITAKELQARFGEPTAINPIDGYDEYTYEKLGLKVQLNKDEPPILHFFNP